MPACTASISCPRTRPSRSSLSGTSWRPPPSEISPMPACTASISCPSFTPSLPTVSAAQSIPRLSGTDPVKPGRTEPLLQGLDSKDQDQQEDQEEQEPSPASQEPLQECLNITLVQFLLCPLNTTFRGIEKLHINIFQKK